MAVLIFNGIPCVEATDIDAITIIEDKISEICNNPSININDEALVLYKNYEDYEFIQDNERQFSNINIEYLCLGDTIKTKLKNCQDEDKMEKLRVLLEDELEIEMTEEGILIIY